MQSHYQHNTVVAALYKFVFLPDYQEIQPDLLRRCKQLEIKGTILLATEGINGTIAGSRTAIDGLLEFLAADGRFRDLEYKESLASGIPFHRMKVKLKKEIVTMGLPDINPNRVSGRRLNAKAWNQVISNPEVLVIDTRNHYEYSIGTFKHAISPETETFREFPEYVSQHLDPEKHRKIAMFCTGGIRCEKAGAFMLEQGFEEVYQLQGGILRYLEEVKKDENLWQGECFVFDGRVSVDENLREGRYEQCFACRRPISVEDRQSEFYQQGVSCPACYKDLTEAQRTRFQERQKQVELAEQRGEQHIGAVFI